MLCNTRQLRAHTSPSSACPLPVKALFMAGGPPGQPSQEMDSRLAQQPPAGQAQLATVPGRSIRASWQVMFGWVRSVRFRVRSQERAAGPQVAAVGQGRDVRRQDAQAGRAIHMHPSKQVHPFTADTFHSKRCQSKRTKGGYERHRRQDSWQGRNLGP